MERKHKVLVGGAILFLACCYYLYYTYYINLFAPQEPFFIYRSDSSSLMNIDFETYKSLAKEIKLTNSIFFFFLFGSGYALTAYSLYGKNQMKIVLVFYTAVLLVSASVLLLALISSEQGIMYRAGAEIKNFVWSPVFLFLLVLAPKLTSMKA